MKSISVFVNKSEGWINVMRFSFDDPSKLGLQECTIENYTIERFTYWLNQVRGNPDDVYMFECTRVE